MSTLRLNQQIGNYRILRIIGEGGMGTVYEAEDVSLQRRVAIKVMRDEIAELPGAQERFLREARAMGAVKSDHIVTIFQVGEERNRPFFVMELLEGHPLSEYLAMGKPMSWKQVIRLAYEIAQGLADAHRKGLIHRDIKPANIFVESSRKRVKILDFGLARPTEKATQLTKTGAVLGTPHYMAPEQASGKKVDERTDIFSLGVILYQMATGELPFKGDSIYEVLMAIGMHTPKPVLEVAPDTPPLLSKLIDEMLSKDREDRPPTANHVLARLEAIEENELNFPAPSRVGTKVQSKTSLIPPPIPGSGTPWGLILGIFVGILVIGAITAYFVLNANKSTDIVQKNDKKGETKQNSTEEKKEIEDQPKEIIEPKTDPEKKQEPNNPKKDSETFKPMEPMKTPEVPKKTDPMLPKKEFPQYPRAKKFDVSHTEFPDNPKSGTTITNSLGMTLMWIPAGEFEMGSDLAEAEPDERPVKRRRITRGFWMSAHEVTQKQWKSMMGNNPSIELGEDLPVHNVSWEDCKRFCDELSNKSGKSYRLPTEAEWEYACRAGSRDRYSFGDRLMDLKTHAWFEDNSINRINPIGKKQANAWGLFDMHGNVEEWCLDWYDDSFYSIAPTNDPICEKSAIRERIVRGGSFRDDADACRSAYRFSANPDEGQDSIGFRVILVPK